MENKNDWEEIKEWQQKNEEKNKYNIDFEEFNKKDRKKVDRFTRFFTIGLKTISLSTIGISIAILASAFVMIYALFYIFTPKDVLKSLKEEYRNEEFVVVENYGAENEKSRGLYLVSPKSEPNIIFKMYNTTQVRSDNDYSSHRIKYYFENCENKELTNNFYVEEFYAEFKDVEFLHYTILIKINNYSEIEEKVKKIFDLKKYFLSKNDKIFEAIFLASQDLTYNLWINIDTTNSLEQEINKIKYQYINQLKEKNSSLLNNISQEEITKIWKPKILKIYMDDEQIGLAEYDEINQEYCIKNLNNVLNAINKIKIVKRDRENIKEIEYNNNKIKVKEEQTDKRNTIYEGIELNDFCNIFDFQMQYNYDKSIVILM